MSVVFVFSASHNDSLPVSPVQLTPVFGEKKSGLLMGVICVLFLLSSPSRLSFVSVAFDFNASPNDVAPVSPMLLSVDLMGMKKKSGLLMDVICVAFLLSSLHRLSSISVVFDFNASRNDVTPASLNKLTVSLMKMRKRCR